MRYKSNKPIKLKLTYRQSINQSTERFTMKVYAWLIDLIHCQENCPTGMISGWVQKVTEHRGTIQIHGTYLFLFILIFCCLEFFFRKILAGKVPICHRAEKMSRRVNPVHQRSQTKVHDTGWNFQTSHCSRILRVVLRKRKRNWTTRWRWGGVSCWTRWAPPASLASNRPSVSANSYKPWSTVLSCGVRSL